MQREGELHMNAENIREVNKSYWNTYADLWFGTTALPKLGVHFPTEEDLHLFGDVSGKKMLEICCGSGHSLKYNADRGAGELWAVDISQKQIDNAKAGFVIEQLVEETDKDTLEATGDIGDKRKKAKMMPISFCIKARKL